MNGTSITVSGDGVTVDSSKATTTSAGTYRLSGSLADGPIIVDTEAGAGYLQGARDGPKRNDLGAIGR